MNIELIRRVERVNLILAILATAGSAISLDPEVIGGVFIGAAIGLANFHMVRLLAERAIANPDQKSAVLGAFLLKFAALVGLIIAVFLLIGINGTAFIAGFSTTVVSVMLVPVLSFSK